MKRAPILGILVFLSAMALIGADCNSVVNPPSHTPKFDYTVTDFQKGPYVQNASQTAAQVVFESEAGGVCEFGSTPDLGDSVDAAFDGATGLSVCYLEELDPGSLVYYRVRSDGDMADGSFVTEPEAGDGFNFAVFGDTRTDHPGHEEVVDAVLDTYPSGAPDMLFNTGDIIDGGANDDLWNVFFDIEGDLLEETVFYPVNGNHDVGAGDGGAYDPWANTGRYYAFRYANALFVVMDTEQSFSAGSPQYDMVAGVLRSAASDPTVAFKFVFCHRPGVTDGNRHDPNTTIVRDYLDLFEETNVDVVFSGHNHNYEHSFLNGVHYVVTGAAGANLHLVRAHASWSVYAESARHYCAVEVGANSYHVGAYRTDGDLMDGFSGTIEGGGAPGPTPASLTAGPDVGCGIAPGDGARKATSDAVLLVTVVLLLAVVRYGRRAGVRIPIERRTK